MASKIELAFLIYIMIKQIMSQNSHWQINKEFARNYGVDATIIMTDIIDKWIYFGEDWFYNTAENIENDTTLSKYKQDKAFAILKENGFLETKVMGIPAKLHFNVNEQKLIEFFSGINLKTTFKEISKLELDKFKNLNQKKSETINNNKGNNNKENKNKIKNPTNDESFDSNFEKKSEFKLSPKGKESPKKKICVSGAHLKITYKKYIDIWRAVEAGRTEFDFQVNNVMNVGQFQNLIKAIDRDLVKKYGEYDEQKMAESVEAVLSIAYKYFTEIYQQKKTSVFLFEPLYVYRHYQKIKTYKSQKNGVQGDKISEMLNKIYA